MSEIARPQVRVQFIGEVIEAIPGMIDARIVEHGRGMFSGKHESLGVITEEFWELVDAAKRDEGFAAEVGDVLVACIWAMASGLELESQ